MMKRHAKRKSALAELSSCCLVEYMPKTYHLYYIWINLIYFNDVFYTLCCHFVIRMGFFFTENLLAMFLMAICLHRV